MNVFSARKLGAVVASGLAALAAISAQAQPARYELDPDHITAASWAVPIHVISAHTRPLKRLEAVGYAPGLLPKQQPSKADVLALTPLLLGVFDAAAGDLASAAEQRTPGSRIPSIGSLSPQPTLC
jgi:hypothetical protein